MCSSDLTHSFQLIDVGIPFIIDAAVYKYVEAQYAHWVVDGGIDDEWDSYIDQLKAMGIDEFLQIQTDAYNAYKKNLAK